VQSLAFVPSPIAQKAQAEQGVNSAPAWSEATLLVKNWTVIQWRNQWTCQ